MGKNNKRYSTNQVGNSNNSKSTSTRQQVGSGNFKELSPQEKAHSGVSGAAYSVTRNKFPNLQTQWVVRVGDKGGILNKSHIQNVLKAILRGPERCIHLACRMQDGAVVYAPDEPRGSIDCLLVSLARSKRQCRRRCAGRRWRRYPASQVVPSV